MPIFQKKNTIAIISIFFILLLFVVNTVDAQKDKTPVAELKISFKPGPAHLNPLFAFWAEDTTGRHLQTIFVSKSVGKATWKAAMKLNGRWIEGTSLKPAALPYWGRKWGYQSPEGFFLPTPDHPVPDAYTGATPINDFRLYFKVFNPELKKFYIFMEINQGGDFNDYFTEDKYYNDPDYLESGQPAIVYSVLIDIESNTNKYEMQAIGYSDPTGKSNSLSKDLHHLTSALKITDKVLVDVTKN